MFLGQSVSTTGIKYGVWLKREMLSRLLLPESSVTSPRMKEKHSLES